MVVKYACRASLEEPAPALQAACKQAVPSQRCLLGLSEGSTLCFLTSSVTLGARLLDEVVERADAQTTKKDTRMSILFCCTKRTGLEPATSAVTGLRSNQTELPLRRFYRVTHFAAGTGALYRWRWGNASLFFNKFAKKMKIGQGVGVLARFVIAMAKDIGIVAACPQNALF